MKPVRTIEKLAYGEGTPDGLADLVPSWGELFPVGQRVPWYSWKCAPRLDLNHGVWHVCAPDDMTVRWFSACLIAHKAGCPPHWVDMGFTFEEGFVPNFGVDQIVWSFRSLHDGTRRRRFSVHADSPNPNNGNRWEVIAARVDGHPIKGAHRFFNTELEARQYAYDLIKEMEQ
jgi:hypothetical protein